MKLAYSITSIIFAALTFTAAASEPAADLLGGPLGIERVALHAGVPSHGYWSPTLNAPDAAGYLQIDLGKEHPIDTVKLFPDVRNRGWNSSIEGVLNSRNAFPIRFKIETAKDADGQWTMFADHTDKDCDGTMAQKVESFTQRSPIAARYVRLTVTKMPAAGKDKYAFRLWRFEALSNGKVVSENGELSDSFKGQLGKHDLLRPRRPDGEFVHFDHPENVTQPETWKRITPPLQTPRSGVQTGGLIETIQKRNENYLLTGSTVRDMARDFRMRAGKAVPPKRDYRPDDHSPWYYCLGSSNAGRFLMGAGNQLRWRDNPKLRAMVNELIDEIADCAEPTGYAYGFPEKTILEGSEAGAYARAWFSMGLVEAGISGNKKAFDILRKTNDWFNQCPYLPEMFLHASCGYQGVIASSRTYIDTPIGVPADIQVLQRYFETPHWFAKLAARDPAAVSRYDYDRPHSYLIQPLTAWMDVYYATGDKRYLEAVSGGWDIFYNDFEHIGGTIAICEGGEYPPKSYWLRRATGELCGNIFWIYFNQQFRNLHPVDGEKYVTEIEKSIYNAAAANQCENGDIQYTAHLLAPKHSGNDNLRNTCCEGQGTRLYGALPEFIYKIADNGIYVDLFNESSITAGGMTLQMHTEFPYRPDVKLLVKTDDKAAQRHIFVRVPSWAAKPMDIFVNGEKRLTGTAASYVQIDVKDGDEVRFTLPMEFRLTKYTGWEKPFAGKETYAVEYGPLLMAVCGDAVKNGLITLPLPKDKLLQKLKPAADKPLHYTIDGVPDLELIPYYEVKGPLLDTFTCFPILEP
ncbi:MAG: glycoside hydrolase family 127 protein [Planctomycetaceae bacterium]|nr:glycoside hydrolase family 127 protein [Planctomycetaceae bacterium]